MNLRKGKSETVDHTSSFGCLPRLSVREGTWLTVSLLFIHVVWDLSPRFRSVTCYCQHRPCWLFDILKIEELLYRTPESRKELKDVRPTRFLCSHELVIKRFAPGSDVVVVDNPRALSTRKTPGWDGSGGLSLWDPHLGWCTSSCSEDPPRLFESSNFWCRHLSSSQVNSSLTIVDS